MKGFKLIDNPKNIDKEFITSELQAGKEVHIQFSEKTYTDKILSDINELCKIEDESLHIRFYGHYTEDFDCTTVLEIPNVKSLHVDCSANNTRALKELLFLKELSLGIYNLEDIEILAADNLRNLIKLSISETKVKSVNLAHLQAYQNLKSLIISGHTKNIEAVEEINNLESLTLHSIKKSSVAFINKLKKLKSLRLLLGGRDNVLEIEENEIEHLEIVWVRGFNDISNISKFRKLKTLHIEDQIQLQKIDFDQILPDLIDLKISNCKTLDTITGLKNLPKLNSLFVNKTNVNFQDFIRQELPHHLKNLCFYTTKSKIDKDIKAILESKGYVCM
jgi:protein phosphatase 1 regulatory subunit 7